MSNVPDEYLGDGVYARFDGYHIVLDLRGQDTFTRIALEPAVFEALQRYQKRCFPRIALEEPAVFEASAAGAFFNGCTNPDGHQWSRTPGEADEARVAGDIANDRIYCIHCGADGDA